MGNKKVLILYASYGEGHRQVTTALEQDFAKKGVRTVSIDLYREAHPYLDAFARYLYKKSFTHGKWLYALSYDLAKHAEETRFNLRPFFAFGIRKLKQIVEREAPDAVVSTFPFLALPELWRRQRFQAPIYTVITDFSLHDFWIHPMIDKYFVATEELKEALINKGYLPEQITVSGIPVRENFRRSLGQERKEPLPEEEPSRKDVLIMAGAANNSSEMKALVRSLIGVNGIQVSLVCGKNGKLQNDLAEEFAGNEKVRVFGYVERVDERMAESSCIVTKPGGVTLTEAISMELPIIVYRPVPGQESENAEFLAKQGAAVLVKEPEDLASEVSRLVADPLNLISMKRALHKLSRKNAGRTIVAEIARELDYPLSKQLLGGEFVEI